MSPERSEPSHDSGQSPEAGNPDQAAAESRLSQALDQLEQQPESQAYARTAEELEGARIDYDNAWTAFLHTDAGRYYHESNQRYQNTQQYHRLSRDRVAKTHHFQNYAAAESHRSGSSQIADQAEQQAAADPQYRQTDEYIQIARQHQSILTRCRQTWRDLGHIIEGKGYQRAKTLADQAEREISLAWAKGSQTPEGQRLRQAMERVAQLEQQCQQAEQAYKQTPAYKEYEAAAEAWRLTVVDHGQNQNRPPPSITPIDDSLASWEQRPATVAP